MNKRDQKTQETQSQMCKTHQKGLQKSRNTITNPNDTKIESYDIANIQNIIILSKKHSKTQVC